MEDFLLISGVFGIVLIAIGLSVFIDKLGGCSHKWGTWEHKEDSAVFLQKRQCSKCGYTQFEQVRLVKGRDT